MFAEDAAEIGPAGGVDVFDGQGGDAVDEGFQGGEDAGVEGGRGGWVPGGSEVLELKAVKWWNVGLTLL